MTRGSHIHRISELEREVEGLKATKGLLQDVLAALCLRDTGKVVVTAEELQQVEQFCGTSGGISWTQIEHGGKPAIAVSVTRAEVGALAAGVSPQAGEPS